ncbi:MAG: sulfite exporter TauE/SafE family protein [Planctomycetales bacterium]|nr:sulfite exporter TauE/SafE family protein [Planctomycetales bacterium]
MLWLSVIFGTLVGLSLGLTGGGGAIFAVPLLVYGLGLEPRAAVGVSLVSVGVTALVGFVQRWRMGQVELPTGLLFAGAGMVGAPAGAWLAGQIPEKFLLVLFAILMGVVAARMWPSASQSEELSGTVNWDDDRAATCQRDASGSLRLTSHCARLLVVIGIAAGVLSGLFGVGGGFIIVPSLVLFSRMPIRRAIGTSLLVITLISVSGVASHLFAGRSVPVEAAALFSIGGTIGMLIGNRLSRRLAGATLQRGFALVIVLVALFVLLRPMA